jgi:hypothetical protein
MVKQGSRTVGFAALVVLLIASWPIDQAGARGRSCFWSRDIRNVRSGWSNNTVNVRVAGGDVFQLRLFSSCPDISWSPRISLRTRGGSHICEGSGLNVEVVPNSRSGRSSRNSSFRNRCRVSSVRRLTRDEVAALPGSARP